MKKELIELIHSKWEFNCKFWRWKSNLSICILFRWIYFYIGRKCKDWEKIDYEPIIEKLADEIINKLDI
jgi:hypothetical protein